MSPIQSFVIEVATALGLVQFPMSTPQEKIQAEIRALKLPANIIEESCEWYVRLNDKKQVVIHTFDDDPGLMIDPCETVERYCKDDNEHLVTYMFLGSTTTSPCVVVANDAPTCAIIDTVISLVLLADCGWPAKYTPLTLAMMRKDLRDCIRSSPLGSTITQEDYDRLEYINVLLENGTYGGALQAIGEHSRKCYTCKGWTEVEVQEHIEPYLMRIPDDEIESYLQSPVNPSDVRFICQSGLE